MWHGLNLMNRQEGDQGSKGGADAGGVEKRELMPTERALLLARL